jgi:hypothetical protein
MQVHRTEQKIIPSSACPQCQGRQQEWHHSKQRCACHASTGSIPPDIGQQQDIGRQQGSQYFSARKSAKDSMGYLKAQQMPVFEPKPCHANSLLVYVQQLFRWQLLHMQTAKGPPHTHITAHHNVPVPPCSAYSFTTAELSAAAVEKGAYITTWLSQAGPWHACHRYLLPMFPAALQANVKLDMPTTPTNQVKQRTRATWSCKGSATLLCQ